MDGRPFRTFILIKDTKVFAQMASNLMLSPRPLSFNVARISFSLELSIYNGIIHKNLEEINFQ